VVPGLLEVMLGSIDRRAFLLFLLVAFRARCLVRQSIHNNRLLLFGLEGSWRKEERGSVWAHLEQHFEAILEETYEKNAAETRQ
jgi:hypothetical protein